jgi:hypothetical protein
VIGTGGTGGGGGGEGGQAGGGSCDGEALGFSTECATCLESNCCDEGETCGGITECAELTACAVACPSTANGPEPSCLQDCLVGREAGRGAYNNVVTCLAANCDACPF